MQLERFEKSDIPELLGWLEQTDAAFLIQFAGPRYIFPLDAEQLEKTLAEPDLLAFKARALEGRQVAGHCQLLGINREKATATIGRVLVKPESRGKGYGEAMMRRLLQYAHEELRLSQLDLKVFSFNTAAFSCYQKLGFKETGREEVVFPRIKQTWCRITMEYRVPSSS